MKVIHAAATPTSRTSEELLHVRAIARTKRLAAIFETGANRAAAAGFKAGDATRLLHEGRPAKQHR